MDIKLNELTQELKEQMNNDPRFILLDKLEKEISENEEIMRLAYKKDMASLAYSDKLKIYSEDSLEIEPYRRALYEAKLALDTHPLIIEYNKAYKNVREVIDNVNNIIFTGFKEDK